MNQLLSNQKRSVVTFPGLASFCLLGGGGRDSFSLFSLFFVKEHLNLQQIDMVVVRTFTWMMSWMTSWMTYDVMDEILDDVMDESHLMCTETGSVFIAGW